MNTTTLAPPAAEPVGLAEARNYLRIGHAGEDDLVLRLVASARARIEELTGLAMIVRRLRVGLRTWPSGVLETRRVALPVRPAAGLVAVRILGSEGEDRVVTSQFQLEPGRSGRLVWVDGSFPWPGPGGRGVEIDYDAGFGAESSDVADSLRLAVLRLTAHAYLRRDVDSLSGPVPEDVAALLSPWRRVKL